MTRLFSCLLLLSTLTACVPEGPDTAAVIEERYRDRIAALTANLYADCRREALAAALLRADSLLAARALRMQRVAGRPPRPTRPGEPPGKELSRPLPLRPLFPFEIRFDTLLRDSLYQDSLRLDSLLRF